MTDMLDWFDTAAGGAGTLSGAARARRGAIRAALTATVVRRRRRTKAVRTGLLTVVAALLIATCWPASLTLPGVAPRRVATTGSRVDLAVVRNSPDILSRSRVVPQALSPEVRVDDQQLLELLDSVQRATGLIRTPGRVVLTHDVTDALGE